MKNNLFSIITLLLVIIIINPPPIHGQKNKLSVGVTAQALSQLAGTSPFRLSWGNKLGIWCEHPISRRSALRLSVGHRGLNGLQLSTNSFSHEYEPREFRRNITTTMLNSLQYIDVGLHWRYTPQPKGPWSIGLGVYAAHLHTWRGARQTNTWAHNETLRFLGDGQTGSYGISGSSDVRALQTAAESLTHSNFQSLDVGTQLQLSYQLKRGLHIQGSYQQGFRNLVNDSLFGQPTQFFSSSLALGFSIRLI